MVQIIRSQLVDGVWSGEFSGLPADPQVQGILADQVLDGVQASPVDDGNWIISVPVPTWAMSDGVHSFVVKLADAEQIGAFTIVAGDAVADDLMSEVSLLRAELDMLKKAFRKHVLETMG